MCGRLPGAPRAGAREGGGARRVARGLAIGPREGAVTARAVGVAPRLADVRRARPRWARPRAVPAPCQSPLCSQASASAPGPSRASGATAQGTHLSARDPGALRLLSLRRAGGPKWGHAGRPGREPGSAAVRARGEGRAVTRRARRIPDSRPPLRRPRTSVHRSPGSSRRRTGQYPRPVAG